jgi:hypothetical protein
MTKPNMHAFLPPADENTERINYLTKSEARAKRTIADIKHLVPLEILLPKNEHLLAPAMRRIYNLLLEYERTTD